MTQLDENWPLPLPSYQTVPYLLITCPNTACNWAIRTSGDKHITFSRTEEGGMKPRTRLSWSADVPLTCDEHRTWLPIDPIEIVGRYHPEIKCNQKCWNEQTANCYCECNGGNHGRSYQFEKETEVANYLDEKYQERTIGEEQSNEVSSETSPIHRVIYELQVSLIVPDELKQLITNSNERQRK